MKLIFCKECHDVIALHRDKLWCLCGKSGGQYLDGINAVWWGPAVPLGFSNFSFNEARFDQSDDPPGRCFKAFVIEKNCKTFKQVSERDGYYWNKT